MAQNAHVTSVDAIDRFRSRLLVYLKKASGAVEHASDQVMQTRLWLQYEKRVYWEQQTRTLAKKLEMAQQELLSARSAGLREGAAAKQMVVNNTRRKLEEARDKLVAVRRWTRSYDTDVGLLVKHLDKLRTLFSNDMQNATSLLSRTVETLETYSDRSQDRAPSLEEVTAEQAIPLEPEPETDAESGEPTAAAGPPTPTAAPSPNRESSSQ